MSELGRLAEPLQIGGVEIRNRVFLAPMSGITDEPFRLRAYRHGAGLVVSEMVASGELAKGRHGTGTRIRHPGLPVHMVQLAGREAHHMAEAARIAAGEGADIIDINMGCPAKKVTGGYSGSALMRDLDHALSLIDAVIGAVDVPVTVKMRLGWDEATLNAPLLARRAEQAGVKMVTVHGRTRCQFYQGKADWRAIARVKQAVSIPVVANGDVGIAGRCRGDPRAVRRRCRHGRPRALRRAVGGRRDRRMPPARHRPATCPPARDWPTTSSRTTRTCCRSTASKAACGRRASISAGISTATRRQPPPRRARRS